MMTENELHPLLRRELRRIRDWKTWKTLWDEAKYEYQLLTLLHGALDIEASGNDWSERLVFFLRIANGHGGCAQAWRDPRPVVSQLDWDTRQRIQERLQPVAEKAFQMLCDKYFKRFSGSERDDGSPLSNLTSELYETLLWFFGDQDRHPYGRNLPHAGDKSHYAQTARNYLRTFVRAAWPSNRTRGGRTAAEEVEAHALRIRLIPLLEQLEDLDFLFREQCDEATAEALRRHVLFDKDGQPVFRSAEEAIGTEAGRCLLLIEAKVREEARKRRIVEMERNLADAARELDEARR